MRALKAGDPSPKDSDLGPMAREHLRRDLHEQLGQSVANGATSLCGGSQPGRDGANYSATILGDVAPGQPAFDDELFGLVAVLLRAKDAMRSVKNTRYRLGGGSFPLTPRLRSSRRQGSSILTLSLTKILA
jgi:acyl-CoA reductase-like NAD-dependent aldehyde dehydrogenase